MLEYEYDELGNVIKRELPNKTKTLYEYDNNNQLIKLESISSSGVKITDLEYTYNEIGNVIKSKEVIEDEVINKEFEYDKEERLVKSIYSSKKVNKEYQYQYDRVGNKILVIESINGEVRNKKYQFDNTNALVSETSEMDVKYSYDDNGNVSQKSYSNGLVEKYTYDGLGQLIEVESSNGKTISYSYDGLGNRVEKVEKTTIESSKNSSYTSIVKEDGKYNEEYDQELVSQRTNEQIDNLSKTISDHLKNYNQLCKGFSKDEKKSSIKTIKYVNDINQEYTQVLQTSNDAGEMIERYTYGIERIDEVRQKEEASYYAYDGLGNVIGKETTKKPNEISFKVSYDDFGKPNKKMDDEYGYNSEAHDYNNSQYLRARYYDSKSGVFNQEDSYLGRVKKPITQNRYAYSHNNPINLEDPSGHYIVFLEDDGDEDYVSQGIVQKIENSKKTGNQITWEQAEDQYFKNNEAAKAKHRQEQAAKIAAAEARAKAENRKIQDEVNKWTGDAGSIAKKYFDQLVKKGYAYDEAYKLAFKVKKICDELSTEHLKVIKDHITGMSSDKIIEFFKVKTDKYTSVDSLYNSTTKTIEWSDFTNFITNKTGWAENSWLWGVLSTVGDFAWSVTGDKIVDGVSDLGSAWDAFWEGDFVEAGKNLLTGVTDTVLGVAGIGIAVAAIAGFVAGSPAIAATTASFASLMATIGFYGGVSESVIGLIARDEELFNGGLADIFEGYTKTSIANMLLNIFKPDTTTQGSGNPSKNINGTSYDAKKLYKTQPDFVTNEGPSTRSLMEKISSEGPNSVDPIPVYVDNGNALIVDGHHRYQAFINLGYDRVPIKYIHENQIFSLFGRNLEELRHMMFK